MLGGRANLTSQGRIPTSHQCRPPLPLPNCPVPPGISLKWSEQVLGTVGRWALESLSASFRSLWLGKSSCSPGGGDQSRNCKVIFFLPRFTKTSRKAAGAASSILSATRSLHSKPILSLLASLCVFLVNHACRTLSIVFKED